MPDSMVNLIVGLGGAVLGALFGSLLAFYLQTRRDKMSTTINLCEQYHSPEMLEARSWAWRYLNSREYLENPISLYDMFSGDFSTEDPSDREERKVVFFYKCIVQVISFWYLVYVLHNRKELINDVASRYFSYQFTHWHEAFDCLYKKSVSTDDKDNPDWVNIMEDKSFLTWLMAKPEYQSES